MIQFIRQLLQKILFVNIALSAVLMLLGELMPTGWLFLLLVINFASILLLIYVCDPRVYYRRMVPICICIGAAIYKIFRFILRHTYIGRQIFRRCYKIKRMAGSYIDCYYHVQYVYDIYSNYNVE